MFRFKKPTSQYGPAKKPGSIQRRIIRTVQTCGNSGLPIAMVPCLHQWNVYIKTKLRVCRAQKGNPCFGTKIPLRSTDLQGTLFHAAPLMADITNLREFGASYRRGTVSAPMECLYQKEAKGMQCSKCNPCFCAKSPLRSTDLQTTQFHAAMYRANSTNLRKFWAIYRHGIVFAIMECIYQNEASCMQCPEL